MGVQFEASRLCEFFPPPYRRHVQGNVITVYNVADDVSYAKRREIPSTELSAEDRAAAGISSRELWFRIIQDGQIFATSQEIDELKTATTTRTVTEFGLLTILPQTFTSTVGVLVFTRATQENMVFLCLYLGHLRSAALFHTALAHQKNRQVNITQFSQTLRQQWLGDPDSRNRPTNSELWVDQHTDVKNKNGLPLIFVGSSTHRIFPLIARELWVTAGSKNVKALLWESLYIENLIKAYDESFTCPDHMVYTAHGCSPFSFWFSEMIISSMIALKDTERCVFDINEMMKAVRVEATQTGGRVDNYLFDVRFGRRVARNLILAPSVDPDPHSTMIGRLSPAFGESRAPLIAGALPGRAQTAAALAANTDHNPGSFPRFRADLVSISNSFTGFHCDELEFIEILRSTWLDSSSLITTIHLPLGIPDAISVILLCQFLWLTIPVLREKAVILVASANSTLICNTTRLLIDSFAPQIRDMFITTKTYLIPALLDGFKKKNVTAHYLESLTQLDEKIATVGTPFKLIISTPDTIEEGWSKEIYTKYIHNDPAAKLIHLRSADAFKNILDCSPVAVTAVPALAKSLTGTIFQRLSENVFDAYFADVSEQPDVSDRVAQADGELGARLPVSSLGRLDDIVNETFNKFKSSSELVTPPKSHIKSLTVWEEIPAKGSYILLDRAIHLTQLDHRYAAEDEPVCASVSNALHKNIDPMEFTKALLEAPYYYLEGQTPVSTPPLDLVRIPVNVQGVEVITASMEPARVILSTQPITSFPPRMVDDINKPTPKPISATVAAGEGDDWLLGLLRGLGEAVQELKTEKEVDVTGKKVSKRAAADSAINHSMDRLYCLACPPSSSKLRSLMLESAPNCDFVVNAVYHRIMSVMRFSRTELPTMSVRCESNTQCQGQCCRNMHHIKVSTNGFNLVQLGVLRELTSRKQV